MALTGIQIYKFLPKTNCKDCGFPTCLAFAMKLATKSVELALCPHMTADGKLALESASRPPIRLVTIGAGEQKFEIGNETVMFRHEKTFFHQTAIAIRIKDTDPVDKAAAMAQEASSYSVERVGMSLKLDVIAIENASGKADAFLKCIEVVKAKSNMPLILMSTDISTMEQALGKSAADRPLIYAATKANCEQMAALAKKYNCPLAVCESGGLDAIAELTKKLMDAGVQDIVIDAGARGFNASLTALTQIRRTAIKASFEALGFPVIAFPGEGTSDAEEEALLATQQIAKYASIIVLDRFAPATVYPLLTLRLNIYTNPQKPIQVTPGIYEIGQPTADSPLAVTTNFSLTYFSVVSEFDAAGYPSWLLVCETEGLSVLTAWAAGKFDAAKISKSLAASGIADKISHRKLIIPGDVAILKGELEDELRDWKIMVGPRDAADIGGYLKQHWK